jgi:hypothetical protein
MKYAVKEKYDQCDPFELESKPGSLDWAMENIADLLMCKNFEVNAVEYEVTSEAGESKVFCFQRVPTWVCTGGRKS